MDLFDLNGPDFEVVGGRSRFVILGQEAEFAIVQREPGAEGGHSHPNEQFVYFLEGEAEFHIGDEKQSVGPGHLLHIPKDIPHGITPKTFVRYVTVYVPPRDTSVKSAEAGEAGFQLAR